MALKTAKIHESGVTVVTEPLAFLWYLVVLALMVRAVYCKEIEVSNANRKYEGGQGPSWWDCEEYVKHLERTWHIKVAIRLHFEGAGPSDSRGKWWATVGAADGHQLSWQSGIGQACVGGQSGHRTFPSALYAALQRYDWLREKREEEAKRQTTF